MQDRSAPKNKSAATMTTTIVEPPTHGAQETKTPLNSDGPKTNKGEERASITKLLSEKLHRMLTPGEATPNLEKAPGELTLTSDLNEVVGLIREPKGFWAQLREQSTKLLQVHSARELFAWAKETITGLFESATYSLRFFALRGQTLNSSPPAQHTLTIDSPASTTHGFTPTPTILEKAKELEVTKTKAIDYTAEGLIAVGEATRKEAESKEQKAEHRRAEELHHKHRVRAEVLAIDARVGGENPELQAILNQLDSVYGSIEVALRSIMEAQAKEMGATRKKVA